MTALDHDLRRVPVLVDERMDRVILRSMGHCWTAGDLLDCAQALADRVQALPDRPRYLINLGARRDDFLIGLLAGMLGGQTNLMPASHTPGAINDLLVRHPDTALLHGHDDAHDAGIAAEIPHVAIPRLQHNVRPGAPATMPRIAPDAVVARVFTSGSTGTPCGHDKTWGRLIENARAASRALGTLDATGNEPLHLLGTVPSQHMYGFESLILAAVCEGAVLSTEQPFFPTDIADALARLPAPRALVTTPYHLHHLLAAGIDLPHCERILCATAPLDPALAHRAEAALGGELQEIYGCTETGQIAVRRPTRDDSWSLMPGIELHHVGDDAIAEGGHIENPIRLGDRIARVNERRFQLLGRQNNQVNIAGKRSSIEFLNAKLCAIDGVIEGTFLDPGAGNDPATARLAAVVCAPGLSAERVRESLRTQVDPVFLPRPLVLVDRLPVNATGKVTRHSLLRLLEAQPDESRAEAS